MAILEERAEVVFHLSSACPDSESQDRDNLGH